MVFFFFQAEDGIRDAGVIEAVEHMAHVSGDLPVAHLVRGTQIESIVSLHGNRRSESGEEGSVRHDIPIYITVRRVHGEILAVHDREQILDARRTGDLRNELEMLPVAYYEAATGRALRGIQELRVRVRK